jgi:hypothetical protein
MVEVCLAGFSYALLMPRDSSVLKQSPFIAQWYLSDN